MTPKQRAEYMWNIVKDQSMTVVPWYLITSYLYYKCDISLLPDEDYDKLCAHILKHWDSIEHPNKDLIDRESLTAGTGYTINEYPSRAMSNACRLAAEDGYLKWNKKRLEWMRVK